VVNHTVLYGPRLPQRRVQSWLPVQSPDAPWQGWNSPLS